MMVQNVSISNFKSVKELEFACRKVNLFIGEPNTGKSNIIEALALFSPGVAAHFRQIIRFRYVADLFFDHHVSQPAVVTLDKLRCALECERTSCQVTYSKGKQLIKRMDVSAGFVGPNEGTLAEAEPRVRYYTFKNIQSFKDQSVGSLVPPYGENLVSLLSTDKNLRQQVRALLESRGLKLQIRAAELEMFVTKEQDGVLFSYSLPTLSETLRRVVFFTAALMTNKGAALVFDEPEANTFPFYTKLLAESIGLDRKNQFFISTHNPYLLQSIIQKTPLHALAIFVTYMRDYQTQLRALSETEISELLDSPTGSVADVFFNLDKLIEHEAVPGV